MSYLSISFPHELIPVFLAPSSREPDTYFGLTIIIIFLSEGMRELSHQLT